MFRENWRDPEFWKWLWRSKVSPDAKVGLVALLLILLVAGGWFAAGKVTSGASAAGADPYVVQRTVSKVVTVREKGKLVRKVVPVVRRVFVQPGTRYDTRTEVVTGPSGTRVVREQVVRYVPKVHDRLVTVNGKTRTVSETRLVPTTSVRTRTQVQTHTETSVVTAQQTVTEARPVTETQLQTQTQYRTVTDTATLTETAPPVTVTETTPAVTVTVTVTIP